MMKGDLHNRTGKKLVGRIVHAVLLASFFIFCSHKSIARDFADRDLESIAVRIGLSILLAGVISIRFKELLPWHTSRLRGDSLLVIMFAGILLYPLFTQFSFLEKSVSNGYRKTVQWSDEQNAGLFRVGLEKFPSALENYRKKHFKTPKEYINVESLIKIYGFRVSPTRKVAMGKNGFFYEGFGARKVEKGIIEQFDNISDYMGQIPFTDSELRQWKRTLEERRFWLKQQGSDFVFVLAPTKAFVYPEYLPAKLTLRKGQTRYEQLVKYLQEETDIYFIDLLPALLEAKERYSYPHLFYKSDFHWNYFGSFMAYQEIMRKLGEFFPEKNIKPLPLEAFELDIDTKWYHKRFIRMLGLPPYLHTNEHYITMVPKEGNILKTVPAIPVEGVRDVKSKKTKLYNSKGQSMDIRLIHSPQAKEKSILLLGDSFLEKCVFYFAAQFQRVLNYRTIVNFPQQIFRFEKPEIVLQEILNMFILRAPPENTQAMKNAYLRHKFLTAKQSAWHRQSFEKGSDNAKVAVPNVDRSGNHDIVICKLVVDAKNNTELSVKGVHHLTATKVLLTQRINPGEKELFFEIPHDPIDTLFFSVQGADSSMPQIKQIEIKTVSG